MLRLDCTVTAMQSMAGIAGVSGLAMVFGFGVYLMAFVALIDAASLTSHPSGR